MNKHLISKTIDPTIEIFFKQHSSLFVVDAIHYDQFQQQVYEYVPFLTLIEFDYLRHIQMWEFMRDIYFLLYLKPYNYFEEPLTTMVYSVRYFVLSMVQKDATFQSMQKLCIDNVSKAYIGALFISKTLLTFLNNCFHKKGSLKEFMTSDFFNTTDLRPFFDENHQQLELIPKTITRLQGQLTRQIIKYTNEHPKHLHSLLKDAQDVTLRYWKDFSFHEL